MKDTRGSSAFQVDRKYKQSYWNINLYGQGLILLHLYVFSCKLEITSKALCQAVDILVLATKQGQKISKLKAYPASL